MNENCTNKGSIDILFNWKRLFNDKHEAIYTSSNGTLSYNTRVFRFSGIFDTVWALVDGSDPNWLLSTRPAHIMFDMKCDDISSK